MKDYIPTIYKKTVLDIDYLELHNKGIRHILFDLDNTLTGAKSKKITAEIVDLIVELKKIFTVDIVSNSIKQRVKNIAEKLDVGYVSFARKPSSKAFILIQKKYGCSKGEVIIIGDQLLTDIKGGNKYGIRTALIDPVDEDMVFTFFNRWRENIKLKKLSKMGNLERGKYYE